MSHLIVRSNQGVKLSVVNEAETFEPENVKIFKKEKFMKTKASKTGSEIAVVYRDRVDLSHISGEFEDKVINVAFVSKVLFSPKSSYVVLLTKYINQKEPNLFVYSIEGGAVPVKVLEFVDRPPVERERKWPNMYWSDNELCFSYFVEEENQLKVYNENLKEMKVQFKKGKVIEHMLAPTGKYIAVVYDQKNEKNCRKVEIQNTTDFETVHAAGELPITDEYRIIWNNCGTTVLIICFCWMEKTHSSYFGKKDLFLLRLGNVSAKKIHANITNVKWNRTGDQFCLTYDTPCHADILDETGELVYQFESSKLRDSPYYSPDGRMLALVGGSAKAGSIEIYDIMSKRLIGWCTASCPNFFAWSPDSRFLLTATMSPKMLDDNKIQVFHYNGFLAFSSAYKRLYQVEFLHSDPSNFLSFDIVPRDPKTGKGREMVYSPPHLHGKREKRDGGVVLKATDIFPGKRGVGKRKDEYDVRMKTDENTRRKKFYHSPYYQGVGFENDDQPDRRRRAEPSSRNKNNSAQYPCTWVEATEEAERFQKGLTKFEGCEAKVKGLIEHEKQFTSFYNNKDFIPGPGLKGNRKQQQQQQDIDEEEVGKKEEEEEDEGEEETTEEETEGEEEEGELKASPSESTTSTTSEGSPLTWSGADSQGFRDRYLDIIHEFKTPDGLPQSSPDSMKHASSNQGPITDGENFGEIFGSGVFFNTGGSSSRTESRFAKKFTSKSKVKKSKHKKSGRKSKRRVLSNLELEVSSEACRDRCKVSLMEEMEFRKKDMLPSAEYNSYKFFEALVEGNQNFVLLVLLLAHGDERLSALPEDKKKELFVETVAIVGTLCGALKDDIVPMDSFDVFTIQQIDGFVGNAMGNDKFEKYVLDRTLKSFHSGDIRKKEVVWFVKRCPNSILHINPELMVKPNFQFTGGVLSTVITLDTLSYEQREQVYTSFNHVLGDMMFKQTYKYQPEIMERFSELVHVCFQYFYKLDLLLMKALRHFVTYIKLRKEIVQFTSFIVTNKRIQHSKREEILDKVRALNERSNRVLLEIEGILGGSTLDQIKKLTRMKLVEEVFEKRGFFPGLMKYLPRCLTLEKYKEFVWVRVRGKFEEFVSVHHKKTMSVVRKVYTKWSDLVIAHTKEQELLENYFFPQFEKRLHLLRKKK